MMSHLSDAYISTSKSGSAKNLDPKWVAEAREDRFFAQLWDSDGSFKSYASAAFAVSCISGLPSAERALFYERVATESRTRVLSHLSGIEVRPGTLRLLCKTDYELFDDRDWRALLVACPDLSGDGSCQARPALLDFGSPNQAGSGFDLLSRNSCGSQCA